MLIIVNQWILDWDVLSQVWELLGSLSKCIRREHLAVLELLKTHMIGISLNSQALSMKQAVLDAEDLEIIVLEDPSPLTILNTAFLYPASAGVS